MDLEILAFVLTGLLFFPHVCTAYSQQEGAVGEVATVTTKHEVNIGLMYNGDYIYFFGSVPDNFFS